jgi:hypothetical protein
MELHILIPGRPAELVARVHNGRLDIVPPANPVPAAAQPSVTSPAAAPAP